jgi:hypothetical protein
MEQASALAPSAQVGRKQAIHRRAGGRQTIVDLSDFETNFCSDSGHYVVYRNIAPWDNHPWEWTLTDSPAEGEAIFKDKFTLWIIQRSLNELAQPIYKHTSKDGVTEYSQALEHAFGESVETMDFPSAHSIDFLV